jgi:DNA-binding response OmpR family regulator
MLARVPHVKPANFAAIPRQESRLSGGETVLVLVVEDDADYAGIIAETARFDGHQVVVVGTDDGARRFLTRESPDLAIVDVILPDGSGLSLTRELREALPRLPIVLLSALDGLSDVIRGLDAGADDYISKPFHPSELRARLRAVSRRAISPSAEPTAAPMIELTFDAACEQVSFHGRDLECTELEARILAELVRVPDQVLTYSYLNERVWNYSNLPDATLLKSHISAIRRKLRNAGCPGDPIRTISRVGYAFSPAALGQG